MTLQTGIDKLSELPLEEWIETIREVSEVVNERKRIQADGKNSRRS